MTTGDHLFGEVIIEDTDAAATRTANEWQGTAIWTDGSRLEDGSVGCAIARHHPEHGAWTGVRVHMGKNQEVYDAELHAIYRAMLTLFREPRGQKITIFADAQAALQRITSDVPGPGQRYAIAIAQQAHDLWEQRRVSVQFRWVPSHAGTAGNEKADEWAKMAARNERGSEQMPYEFSSTSLAHLKRGITERKWVEACSWMESRLSKHHAYRPRKRMQPDPTPAKASKAVASRYYQLRTGHALIGPYLKKIGKRASDACWWCDRGVKQSREHLLKSCKKWKSQQAILWAEVRKKTKKRKGQVQISELFAEEKYSPAVLDFLRSTDVGRTVPREDGENEEDQDGASESSGAED
jgi:ribonuclease HI